MNSRSVSKTIDQTQMSFLDHLEELRWHVIRAFIAVLVFAIAAFVASDFVFGHVILGPSRTDFITYELLCQLATMLNTPDLCIDQLPFILQSRQMTGQFTMHISSSFFVGIVCAFPYAFWEVWRFISPGLYHGERKKTRGVVIYVSMLFLIGVLFGYFLLSPLTVYFLSNYQIDPSILNEFDIISYVTTVTTLVLVCGLLFQLPMVVYFLTKTGLITPAIMKVYRRHALVVIFVLGAMVTPPDPFSMILVAIPLTFLYQFSIWIAKRTLSGQLKRLNK